MNDLRQQQVQVAATSSSVNLAATQLCSNSSSSNSNNSNSSSCSASVSPRSTSTSSSNSNSSSNSSSSVGSTCKAAITTTTATIGSQQKQEEEEQQVVSSTSSPAQRQQQQPQQQQLNVSPATATQGHQHHQQHQQQRQQHQRQQQQLVGQITSTTASPPQHRLCDDAQLPNSNSIISSSSNSTESTAATTTAAATTTTAMVATALDVNGEENNSNNSSTGGGSSSSNNSSSNSHNSSNSNNSSSSSSHKIVLKLSKHGNNTTESLTVNDERRVEPLRIQLATQTPTSSQAQIQANQCIVPKITIRPIKPLDVAINSDASSSCSSSSCADEEQLPHIVPKLTIRAANEERVSSVVPKLIIKMPDGTGGGSGSEANNFNSPLKSGGAGVGSLPKLTIKTTKLDGGNELQLISCSLSPASASSSSACSSASSGSSGGCSDQPAMPTVPKLMIKTTHAGSSCISSAEQPQAQQQQIPKLTIKTAGGPEQLQQLQQHTVIMTHDAKNSQCIPKLTIKTKSIELEDELQQLEQVQQQQQQLLVPKLTIKTNNCIEQQQQQQQQQPLLKLTIKNLLSPKHKVRAVLEEKLMTSRLTLTNGGESSSSNSNNSQQEFCGFVNATKATTVAAAAALDNDDEPETDELRRNSDDMDIDDALSKEHDPKIFHNLPPAATDAATAAATAAAAATASTNGFERNLKSVVHQQQQQHNIVDMVDLTSSPSPGSSPAHVASNNSNYATTTTASNRCLSPQNRLLECLRMQVVMQAKARAAEGATATSKVSTGNSNNNSSNPASPNSSSSKILLSQLTAPPKSFSSNNSIAASKYPQLTERLMANGADDKEAAAVAAAASTNQSIIDSIEILDTPEGSPQLTPFMESAYEPETTPPSLPPLTNHVNHINLNLREDNQQHQQQLQHNNNENHLKRQQLQLQPVPNAESPSGLPPSKQRRLDNNENDQQTHNYSSEKATVTAATAAYQHHQLQLQLQQQQQPTHRSRKQKHERILNTELEEPQQAQLPHMEHALSNGTLMMAEERLAAGREQLPLNVAATGVPVASTPSTVKRRGRPKRIPNDATPATLATAIPTSAAAAAFLDATADSAVKSRRVQLLRKRLAIDMVSAEQPAHLPAQMLPTMAALAAHNHNNMDEEAKQILAAMTTPKHNDHRQLRATRRSTATTPATPTAASPAKATRKRQSKAAAAATVAGDVIMPRFGTGIRMGTEMEIETTPRETNNNSNNNNSMSYALAAHIDLTMCSSSSSTSNGSATTTTALTTATATSAAASAILGGSTCSMLPPTTILSSSDPLPDVIFQPNDFSSIMATQQLRSPHPNNNSSSISGGSQHDSQDEDNYSAPDHSGDDEFSAQGNILGNFGGGSAVVPTTPTRGRGRGRVSRGGGGSALGGSARNSSGPSRNNTANAAQPRVPRMSRGASAVAKAIAQSRPRCIGGLKHQPDPDRLKGLFSPSPQIFEEDTRMSADLNNSNQSVTSMEPPLMPQKQPDFLNNEESQSSMMSSISLMDSNQGQSADAIIGSALKRPKKKKMEICVADDADFNASSIAEYDWPPPKGCCPSKNRDTFMIQEQVALYLGITSFKRKYPDLPRRPVDMEERNWLQEKGLVSEKMCDLGITAVWASDILDIMYTDFYDKYEEYKEFIRQKHLRDIEAKQKALGLTVANGRGLQARDRAMLSASKWNVYFNKTRKEERVTCLDLQTFTLNKPAPQTAPSATQLQRTIVNAVRYAALEEDMIAPPILLAPRSFDEAYKRADYSYPLALVPGQFTSNYYQLSSEELITFPLNSALEKSETELLLDVVKGQQTNVLLTGTTTASVRRSQRARQQLLLRGNDLANTCGALYSSDGSSDASGSESDTDGESDSSCSSSASSRSSDTTCSSINSNSETRLSSNCGVCQRSQHRNAANMPEAFIRCYSCQRRVHPSCIEMPQRMVGRVRNYNWQCAECKCCIKCRSSKRPGKMLYCEQCDRGYHIYCLGVKTVPDGRWSCERCSMCMRCGATRPEGLPSSAMLSPNGGGDKSGKPVKHKKVKWMNEYRIDHITNLREHCNMLCVPCARSKPTKRTPPPTPSSNSSISSQQLSSPQSQTLAQYKLRSESPVETDSGVAFVNSTDATAALSPRTCSISGSVSSGNISIITSTSNTVTLMAPPVAAEVNTGVATMTISGKRMHLQVVNRSHDIAPMQGSSFNRNSNDDATAAAAATISTVTPAANKNSNSAATTTAAAPTTTAATATNTIGIAPPPVVA